MWKQLSVSLALVAAVSVAQGQQREPAGAPGQDGRTNPQQQQPGVDRTDAAPRNVAGNAAAPGQELQGHIANCLVLGNQGEVALSKWALERTQNPQTRQFAQQMVDDHTKLLAELQRFATAQSNLATPSPTADAARSNRSDANPATGGRPENSNAAGAPVRPQNAASATQYPAHGGDIGSQLFAIEQRAAAECLQLTQQDLAKYEGSPNFDQAYIGVQVGMHNHLLAKLRAAEPHATGEFQALLQRATQTAMQHKQHAEQIMDQLAAVDSAGARRAAEPRPAGAAARPAVPATPAAPSTQRP